MHHRAWSGLVAACTLLAPATASAAASPTASRVLVVYNQAWPRDADGDGVADSEQVARYYAAARGVPAANLLGVSCSTGEYYYYYSGEWPKFRDEMLTPIKTKLAALGPTAIDVICFCYGVPYCVYPNASTVISLDNVVMGLNHWTADGSNVGWSTNPYFEPTPGFGSDLGHFDHAVHQFVGTHMYLVSRLDGPRGVGGALELVDQARYADRFVALAGWHGNAYVDSRDGQGGGGTLYTDAYLAAQSEVQIGDYSTYHSADENMAWAEHAVVAAGLPLRWENSPWSAEIGESGARYSDGTSAEALPPPAAPAAPDALLYGGWYNYGTYHDVFRWLPGSVACDLDSDSLNQSTLRDPGSTSFGPSALARGATCVAGVTNEPYLTGHPRPNVLLAYLLRGYTFAEAAALSTPSVGWMPISIGDPLYAPFRAKVTTTDTRAPTLASGYPKVTAGTTADARVVSLLVSDAAEPEVAQVDLDYGATAAYGATVSSGQGWWRRHALTATGIPAGSAWHFRLRLRDPAGNTTTTGDFAMDGGGGTTGGTTTGGTTTGGTTTGGTTTGGTTTGGTTTGGSTTAGSSSGGGGGGGGCGLGGGIAAIGVGLALIAQRRTPRA